MLQRAKEAGHPSRAKLKLRTSTASQPAAGACQKGALHISCKQRPKQCTARTSTSVTASGPAFFLSGSGSTCGRKGAGQRWE